MDLGWLDLGIVALVAVCAFRGFGRGLVREGMAFGGLAAGVVLAAEWQSQVAALLGPFVGGGRVVEAAAYLAIVLAVLGCATVLTVILQRLLRLLFVGWLDRLGGALFGAGQGAILATLLAFVMLKYPLWGLDDAVAGSGLAAVLLSTLPAGLAYLPPELSTVGKFFELPKTP